MMISSAEVFGCPRGAQGLSESDVQDEASYSYHPDTHPTGGLQPFKTIPDSFVRSAAKLVIIHGNRESAACWAKISGAFLCRCVITRHIPETRLYEVAFRRFEIAPINLMCIKDQARL